jgi:hypothetical protein
MLTNSTVENLSIVINQQMIIQALSLGAKWSNNNIQVEKYWINNVTEMLPLNGRMAPNNAYAASWFQPKKIIDPSL